jgi:hypothetical protein
VILLLLVDRRVCVGGQARTGVEEGGWRRYGARRPQRGYLSRKERASIGGLKIFGIGGIKVYHRLWHGSAAGIRGRDTHGVSGEADDSDLCQVRESVHVRNERV